MIEPTDEMREAFERAFEFATSGDEVVINRRAIRAGLAAVLALVEPAIRAAIAEDIKQALAADEADSDVTSGEAIWEQSGYRRGLADAAEIAATPPQ